MKCNMQSKVELKYNNLKVKGVENIHSTIKMFRKTDPVILHTSCLYINNIMS